MLKVLQNSKIAIIGLGYVGLPLAVAFSKKYKTIGYDIDVSRVLELQRGKDRTLEIGENDLKDLYIALWAKENSNYAYKNNSNLMTQIKLKDKTIFYNQDYEAVLDICKTLSIPFDNQSLISIGLDLYNRVNPDFSLSNFYSHFNTETAHFFRFARRDNLVTSYKDGKAYELKDVSSLDICKCYSTRKCRNSSTIFTSTMSTI